MAFKLRLGQSLKVHFWILDIKWFYSLMSWKEFALEAFLLTCSVPCLILPAGLSFPKCRLWTPSLPTQCCLWGDDLKPLVTRVFLAKSHNLFSRRIHFSLLLVNWIWKTCIWNRKDTVSISVLITTIRKAHQNRARHFPLGSNTNRPISSKGIFFHFWNKT